MKKMIFLLIALLMATCFASGDLHVRIKCKPADPDTGYFARDVKVELWDSAEGGSLLYSACADKDYYAHFYNIPEGTYFIAIVGARDPMDMTGRNGQKEPDMNII